MVTQMFQLPLQYCVSSLSSSGGDRQRSYGVCSPSPVVICNFSGISDDRWVRRSKKNRRFGSLIAKQEKGDVTEIRIPVPLTLEQEEKEKQNRDDDDEYEDVYEEGEEVDPEDLKCVNEIKRVLELLRRNRDMIFSEVKLTIMIEDPREVERRRLLGIEDSETPSRDDLAEALEQVNDGKVPKDRATLRMLHEEMMRWPNLEVEVSKKQRGKSMYAKSTDTGIDPKEAAKRLNIEWDSAAAIEEADVNEEQGVVTKVAGYGALYFVSALPVIIGVSVVLILFYNSLQ
ncbi:PREDICTED: ycf3-interacting protein 1, chloroplastic [Camelina sativa]|uniref:Ycf3-interacting protein 1, chloroplastic n=1 Tax=Camelina sativa TaxID=90675 RepID=A0ABM0Y2M6_CAMSA|nr:PREDICTED: ycf3-interacting protein 1, chloroplastic [Camelina sativa]